MRRVRKYILYIVNLNFTNPIRVNFKVYAKKYTINSNLGTQWVTHGLDTLTNPTHEWVGLSKLRPITQPIGKPIY